MKQILMALGIVVMLVVIPPVAIIALDINVEEEIPTEEITMTVDDFVSLPGNFYYIVKAEGDFGVLESDVYMDREVVEVAVCDDTENTICLFIQLEENEEPHYRKVN
jgi:hypothetical protein